MAGIRFCPNCNYRLQEYKGIVGYTPRFCQNCGFDFQKEPPRPYEPVCPLGEGFAGGSVSGASSPSGVGSMCGCGAAPRYGGGFLAPLFAMGMLGSWFDGAQAGAGVASDGPFGFGQADGYSALDDYGIGGDVLGACNGGDFCDFGDFCGF